jgi:FeS assembly protein IscX
MGLSKTLSWLDVDRIGEALHAAHPKIDPLTVRFTELRRMVEALPNFKEEPGHPVNEKILEAIQMAWHDEREDGGEASEDEDED